MSDATSERESAAKVQARTGLSWAMGTAGLAVAYYAMATLGLSMAYLAEQVSPVWPPSGIALAALLLMGIRHWPGVTIGALVANAMANEPLATAGGIAVGNTLEAVTGAWLLRRSAGFDASLSRTRDVVRLVVLGACASTIVSATIGVTSLCLGAVHPWNEWRSLWAVWWLGDSTGILILAPMLLVFGARRIVWSKLHFGEAASLLIGLVSVCVTVFGGHLTNKTGDYSSAYLVFPFVIWGALRFGQHGAAAVSLIASTLAIWGTVQGHGPFGAGAIHERLLMLQIFLGVVAVTSMTLGAVLTERRTAEAALRQQREWLHVTLTSIDDAVITTDAHGKVTFLNPLAETLTGWGQAALGRHLNEVFRLVHETTREPIASPIAPVLHSGAPMQPVLPALLIARNGLETPVEDSAAPIRDVEGNIIGVVQVFRDTSPRRRDERRLGVLHAVTRILVESPTLAEAAPRILQTICERFEWRVGALWQLTSDSQLLRCVNVWQDTPPKYAAFEAMTRQTTFAPGLGLPGRVWARGESAWIADIVLDSNFPRAAVARQECLHGAFGIPIRLDGDVLGVMEFFSPEIREPDEELLRVMDTIGSQIGQFLDRQQIEQAVRESEERFRTTFTHSAVGMALMDPSGRFLHANPAFCHITGYSEQELCERSYTSMTPPEDLPAKQTLIQRLLDGAIPSFVIEKRYVKKDGGDVWVQNSESLIRDRRGRPKYLVVLVEDITERKRAVEALCASEEQLRLALEAGRMGAWDWNIQSGRITWSPALEAIHGMAPGSFDGTMEGFARDIHRDDRERVQRQIQETLEQARPHEIEYRIVWPDGSVRWVQGRGRLFHDASGRTVRMTGVCLDITRQKQAEQNTRMLANASAALVALDDYESSLHNVVSVAIPDFADWCAIDLTDAQGMLRAVAVAHADSIDATLTDVFQRRNSSDQRAAIGDVLGTGQSELVADVPDAMLVNAAQDDAQLRKLRDLCLQSYLCVPLTARGKTFGVLTLITTKSGRRYDAVDLAVAEDLAYRTAVAIQNAQLYNELRDADRRKDEYLALLAHELRNPLAPIRNGVEAMRIIGLSDLRLQELRDMMERQLDHMGRLVDDLLDVSRVTRGKVRLQLQPTDLARVVAHAVETCRPILDRRHQKLDMDSPSEPLLVQGDAIRLAQVFTNLLNNAAKYSKENARISLCVGRAGAEAMVRVRDEGIGIAPDMLPHIFELFAQADVSLGRSGGGLGIGLTLVRSLVEMHGGMVQAFSDGVGQGSEFVVRLPLLVESPREPGGESASTAAPPITALRRSILVVDDNKDSAKSLAVLLKLMGHEVRLAHDGPAALRGVQTERPEVVLLDIGLPGIDGLEVARRLRRDFGMNNALLIAMTGYGQEEDRRNSFEAGFDAHFVKPVDVAALRSLLNQPEHGRSNK